MLYIIIALFALGAALGVYLLALVLKGRETPGPVVLAQGGFVSLVLLMLVTSSWNSGPGLTGSIIMFVTAALGALVLTYRDITARPVPKWLAVLHGLAAVSGFVFLLVFSYGVNR